MEKTKMDDLNNQAGGDIITDLINLINKLNWQAENLSNKFRVNDKWTNEEAYSRYDMLTDCINELTAIVQKYRGI
jgi:hypothetical protein